MESKLAESLIYNKEFFEGLKKVTIKGGAPSVVSSGGARRSKVKGRGSEFSDFREYMPGDDIRLLDWNVFGRLQKLYIKRFLEERELTCHVCVDVSSSMKLDNDKYVRSLQLAGLISYMALQNGDRVKVIFYKDDKAVPVFECFGGARFYSLLSQIEHMAYEELPNGTLFAEQIRPSGITVFISDFYPSDKIDHKYLHFGKKQQLILMQVLGKEELNPDFEGVCELVDSENEGRIRVLLSNKVAKEYSKRLKLFCAEVEENAKRNAGVYLQVNTTESIKAIVSKGTGTIWL